jgi:ABC-type multidrug transport system fused ATPase/permease subunit
MYGIAGERLTMRLREELFESMVQQEVAWFDKKSNNSGSLCARLSGDASSVRGVSICAFNELPHMSQDTARIYVLSILPMFPSSRSLVIWLGRFRGF